MRQLVPWQYPFVKQIERLLWQPWVPSLLLGYILYRCATSGLTVYRAIAIVWLAIWLAIAICDRRSGGRLLRFVRSHDDDRP